MAFDPGRRVCGPLTLESPSLAVPGALAAEAVAGNIGQIKAAAARRSRPGAADHRVEPKRSSIRFWRHCNGSKLHLPDSPWMGPAFQLSSFDRSNDQPRIMTTPDLHPPGPKDWSNYSFDTHAATKETAIVIRYGERLKQGLSDQRPGAMTSMDDFQSAETCYLTLIELEPEENVKRSSTT
jgi:hypothetical protein